MTSADAIIRSAVVIQWAEGARSDRLLIRANLADDLRLEALNGGEA